VYTTGLTQSLGRIQILHHARINHPPAHWLLDLSRPLHFLNLFRFVVLKQCKHSGKAVAEGSKHGHVHGRFPFSWLFAKKHHNGHLTFQVGLEKCMAKPISTKQPASIECGENFRCARTPG